MNGRKVTTMVMSASTAIILFSIGLAVDRDRLARLCDRKSPSFRALVATEGIVVLFLPACSFFLLLAQQHPPPTEVVLGLMTIACVPGGSFSNMMALPAGANVELNVSLTMCSSLFALCLLPLSSGLLVPRLLSDGAAASSPARVPFGELCFNTLVLMILPLLGGITCARVRVLHTVAKRFLPVLLPLVLVAATVFSTMQYVEHGIPKLPLSAFCLTPALVTLALGAALLAALLTRASAADTTSMVLESCVHDFGLATTSIYATWRHADDSVILGAIAVAAVYAALSFVLGFCIVAARIARQAVTSARATGGLSRIVQGCTASWSGAAGAGRARCGASCGVVAPACSGLQEGLLPTRNDEEA